jgi:serine/threonine protein kinase
METNKVRTYLKEKYLGKGGFAYCLQVIDLDSPKVITRILHYQDDTKYAMKIMPKIMNGKIRSKAKIQNEVSILSQMDHPNIAKLVRAFENDKNVYLWMELCENQSLIELMKNRKRITETEVRSYMAQLTKGLIYVHSKKIVHRDLKLGNLFLSKDMQLKIGDFGLSERIENGEDRLQSLSGTPNYIAPEILWKEGHSYEVDIWAMGVIAYTLLVGMPPFQTKSSKTTCNRIKQVMYTYPIKMKLTSQWKDFIDCLLQRDPKKRLKLNEILSHPFFSFPYPELCSNSTMFQEPYYEEIKEITIGSGTPQKVNLFSARARSITNLRRSPKIGAKLGRDSGLDYAEDNVERQGKEESPEKKVIEYATNNIQTSKSIRRNIFAPIERDVRVNEKQQFKTKMNLDCLESRYHPTDQIDIPRLDGPTASNSPVGFSIN